MIGAAIGGLAGVAGPLLTTLIQQRREDRRALRPELRDIVVSFTAASQDAWDANRKLALFRSTVRNNPDRKPALRALEKECEIVDRNAHKALANLRLTHPELGQLGTRLAIVWSMISTEYILNPESEIDIQQYWDYYWEATREFENKARDMLRIDQL